MDAAPLCSSFLRFHPNKASRGTYDKHGDIPGEADFPERLEANGQHQQRHSSRVGKEPANRNVSLRSEAAEGLGYRT